MTQAIRDGASDIHLEPDENSLRNPKTKVTFATAIRSVLRQDPDVIMVGEIRDLETAETAIRAALTGHPEFNFKKGAIHDD